MSHIKAKALAVKPGPSNPDSSHFYTYLALVIGLVAVLALGAGFIALRRRRAH